jgi:hypothetical protein
VLTLTVALPAQATVTSVRGTAFGPLETDTIYVTLDVSGERTAARGVFRIIHQTPGGIFASLIGDIDCLTEIPGVLVTLTGTIRGGFDGLGINPVGHRVSILLGLELLRPSLSLDVSFASGHAIAPCTADPVLTIPIARGGFLVT